MIAGRTLGRGRAHASRGCTLSLVIGHVFRWPAVVLVVASACQPPQRRAPVRVDPGPVRAPNPVPVVDAPPAPPASSDGCVERVTARGIAQSPAIGQCVAAAVAGITFEGEDVGPVTYSFPIVFSPGG